MSWSVTPLATGLTLQHNGGTFISADIDGNVSAKVNGTVQSLANIASIGITQTWQDLTASRALATTYTNTSGRPIHVSVTGVSSAVASIAITFNINGVSQGSQTTYANGAGHYSWQSFIIPPGATYSVAMTASGGTHTIFVWKELR